MYKQAGWDENKVCIPEYEFQQRVLKYARFLKQPLKLGMFVPCDEKGNILHDVGYCLDNKIDFSRNEYNKAKENVLFKGFTISSLFDNTVQIRHKELGFYYWYSDVKYFKFISEGVIEDLNKVDHGCSIKLTQTAINQLK